MVIRRDEMEKEIRPQMCGGKGEGTLTLAGGSVHSDAVTMNRGATHSIETISSDPLRMFAVIVIDK